jgi:signal peptidase I
MDEAVEISEPGAAEPPAQREQTTIREYIESLLVTVILALFGTTFVVQAFKIPSPSMEPTLLVGDHLLVNKFIFGARDHWYDHFLPYRAIRRGDVIVFPWPYEDHPYYVKRVIGLPGDRLKLVDQKVYINGQPLDEPYAVHDPMAPYDVYQDNFPPVSPGFSQIEMQPKWAAQILNYVDNGELVIPPGKYFAMGDNRDRSSDSRYWGFVDRDAILGRPVVIYWSMKSTENDYEERGTGGWLLDLLYTVVHLPSLTRGSRMFHLVH